MYILCTSILTTLHYLECVKFTLHTIRKELILPYTDQPYCHWWVAWTPSGVAIYRSALLPLVGGLDSQWCGHIQISRIVTGGWLGLPVVWPYTDQPYCHWRVAWTPSGVAIYRSAVLPLAGGLDSSGVAIYRSAVLPLAGGLDSSGVAIYRSAVLPLAGGLDSQWCGHIQISRIATGGWLGLPVVWPYTDQPYCHWRVAWTPSGVAIYRSAVLPLAGGLDSQWCGHIQISPIATGRCLGLQWCGLQVFWQSQSRTQLICPVGVV